MARDLSTQRSAFSIARQDSMTECVTDHADVSIVWSRYAIPLVERFTRRWRVMLVEF
jgi:hypothetical protein